MIVSLIVAASENNAIGKDNQLLWHLPNDLKFFKNTTWGMPVVMGRKTYESIAGDPLPGRFNIVVTRNTTWNPGRADVWVVSSIEEAIAKAKETDCKEVFVIGGGEIYRQSLSVAHKVYLTRVHTHIDGDTFFPELPSATWSLVNQVDFPADEKHAYAYSFQVWQRKK